MATWRLRPAYSFPSLRGNVTPVLAAASQEASWNSAWLAGTHLGLQSFFVTASGRPGCGTPPPSCWAARPKLGIHGGPD